MTTASAESPKKRKRTVPGFAQLQRVGRSLMLPIAVLPAAALLMRFGQPDMLGPDGLGKFADWLLPVATVFAAAGSALFDNLPLIFAVGVAIGFAKKADGSTALAAVVGYMVLNGVFTALAPVFGSDNGEGENVINYGVLGGIVVGIVTALLYQRYHRIKLPTYLGFFGGRRFVPIVTAIASMFIAVIMGLIYPVFDTLINKGVGGFLMEHGANPGTGFVFGTVNRLLIPFGLHHLLNNLPWFQLGSCTNSSGDTVHGDITCFFSGVDGTADWTGSFMTGFFPIMMFALPAAALAIYLHRPSEAPQGRRRHHALRGSHRLHHRNHGTARIRIRLYVAFPLYAVHAGSPVRRWRWWVMRSASNPGSASLPALSKLSSFNLGRASELSGGIGPVLLLLVIGLAYAVVYYFLFRWAIIRFNLHTPGREDENENGTAEDSFRLR